MHYNDDTIFIIGDSKSSQKNPITIQFHQFFLGLVVDRTDGRIIDAECSATIELTVRFVRSLLVGRFINDSSIIDEIRLRYFGSSQRALIVAFNDALKKYNQVVAALST
ncbi:MULTISPECIES: DUF3870 domain-containing protein [unclassified Sporolactobacillus]|uniref:DUF3870 domain-containing protein n=1 Tax=unclassified Sporolactobacillus TaxID=2628533 RepID=UPI002368C2EC|nr:DUF3870 domain-containing protein [Sporolactobacillus sp. CQH2019]MDD9148808.1 DUF3870 domain-containing protein [Sporolactobacillus sp. CQH2019]